MSTVGEFLKPYITNVTDRVSEALEKEAQRVVAEVRAMYLDALRPSAQLRAEELTRHLRKEYPDIFGPAAGPELRANDDVGPATGPALRANNDRDGGGDRNSSDNAFFPGSSSSSSSSFAENAANHISSSFARSAEPAAGPTSSFARSAEPAAGQENMVVRALRGVAVEAFRAAVEDMLKKTIVPSLQQFAETLQTSVVEEVPLETDEFMKTLLEKHVKNLVRATREEVERRRRSRAAASAVLGSRRRLTRFGGGGGSGGGRTIRERRRQQRPGASASALLLFS